MQALLRRAFSSASTKTRLPQWVPSQATSPLVKPTPWLGAYYSIREDQPAAVKNRQLLRGKARPKRARFIVQTLDKREVDRLNEAEPWRSLDSFDRGDILEVEHLPAGAESPERIVGLCIAQHRKGLHSSFRLLCKPDGFAVEYQFQNYSPALSNILLRQQPRKRPHKLKLYYMRDKVDSLKLPPPTKMKK